MKKSNSFKISGLFLFSFITFAFIMFLFVSVARADVTPTLTLSTTGDGDSVVLNVNGTPNENVLFVYVKNGSTVQQTNSIGNTNANGIFTTNVSTSAYGIVPGSLVHVVVGGITGLNSPDVTWPTTASLLVNSNVFSLVPTNVTLSSGQTYSISVNNLNNGNSLYMQSNSNPLIANFSISGSQINILANSYGSTTGTFCSVAINSVCGSIYVTVQNASTQTTTSVPYDCTGASYSISTGVACPSSSVITAPPVSTYVSPTASGTSIVQNSSAFKFTEYLKLGSKGTEVIKLQEKLKTLGFYKGKADGGFGSATESAVKAFQKKHKLPQAGTVGPKTRALLNQ